MAEGRTDGRRRAGLLAAVVLLVALAAAGAYALGRSQGDEAAKEVTSTATDRPAAAVIGARKTSCPASLTGEEQGSVCRIADLAVETRSCASHGPGGTRLRVRGISCAEGRALRLPLAAPIDDFSEPSTVLYEPAVASGPLSELVPERPTGWTCHASFDPDRGGIRHLCWRGSSLVRFTFG